MDPEGISEGNKGLFISQQFAKESIHSLSWLIVFKISGIISSIIIANLLLVQQFGIYSVLSSWGLILNYFCSMGIPIAAAKIISENRAKKPETNYLLIANIIFINVLNFMIILFFSLLTLDFFATRIYNVEFYEIQMFKTLLLLILLKALIYTFYSLEQGIATGYREFRVIAIIFILGYSLKIPVLYILATNYQLNGVLLAEILTELIIFACFFVFLVQYFNKNDIKFRFKIQKKYLKQVFLLGIPSFISNIIFIFANWFGLTILAINFSFFDVGYFQTSLNIVNLIIIIPYGIISPFLPDITEKYTQNSEKFYQTILKVLKLIVLIIFPVVILVGLFSPYLIGIFYPRYNNLITFYSVFILLPYIFINGFTMVLFYSFIAMNKSRVLILLEACKAFSFVILTIFLVPAYGIIGLSYVYLFSFLIYSIIYHFMSIHYKFKTSNLPFVMVSLIYGGFLYYSLIFSTINISSFLWVISALIICFIVSSASFILLWKDQDCKNFILSLLDIFKRHSNLD